MESDTPLAGRGTRRGGRLQVEEPAAAAAYASSVFGSEDSQSATSSGEIPILPDLAPRQKDSQIAGLSGAAGADEAVPEARRRCLGWKGGGTVAWAAASTAEGDGGRDGGGAAGVRVSHVRAGLWMCGSAGVGRHLPCQVLRSLRRLRWFAGDSYMRPWVIPVPEVSCVSRNDDDDCLIIASDGLWDVISLEEVGDLARSLLKRHRRNGLFDDLSPSPSQAVLIILPS